MMELTHEQKALNYYKSAALQGGRQPWPMPQFVPKTVLLLFSVKSDVDALRARAGEYPCTSNKWGAISIEVEGRLLGIRLGEFEVLEWQPNPHIEKEGE